MRYLVFAAAILAAIPCARGQIVGETPDPSDRVAWLGFCSGFYDEIRRQATLDNNTLLYNRASQNLSNYSDEALVYSIRQLLNPGVVVPWQKRGATAAGGDAWDVAPLLDAPGQTPMRTEIMALRSGYAHSCDDMAAQSQQFHAQAESIRRASTANPSTVPDTKSTKKKP